MVNGKWLMGRTTPHLNPLPPQHRQRLLVRLDSPQGARRRAGGAAHREVRPPSGQNGRTAYTVRGYNSGSRGGMGHTEGTFCETNPMGFGWKTQVDEFEGQVVGNFWQGRFSLGSSPPRLGSVRGSVVGGKLFRRRKAGRNSAFRRFPAGQKGR